MKNLIDRKTGKYLTQTAYDAWLNDGQSDFDKSGMWTSEIDEAATFDGDDAPPTGEQFKLVEAK